MRPGKSWWLDPCSGFQADPEIDEQEPVQTRILAEKLFCRTYFGRQTLLSINIPIDCRPNYRVVIASMKYSVGRLFFCQLFVGQMLAGQMPCHSYVCRPNVCMPLANIFYRLGTPHGCMVTFAKEGSGKQVLVSQAPSSQTVGSLLRISRVLHSRVGPWPYKQTLD